MSRINILGRRQFFLGSSLLLAPSIMIGRASAATSIQLDEAILRQFGARLDGVSDDSNSIQKAIDYALHSRSINGRAAAAIILPAGDILISRPIYTRGANFSLRGAGQDITVLRMARGGQGAIIHGDSLNNAVGYLELANLSIVDNNPQGSGSTAVVTHHASNAIQPAMTWQNVVFRKWRTAAKITNCPRNWHCENVTAYGPDFQMQPGAAFEITSNGTSGCFTYNFINVFVANYAWGWNYNISAALEGQRFISCTCYNGWGMVRAVVQSAQIEKTRGRPYQSLLWSFDNCDWQGLGYALDMIGCRDVRVSGGYYIANINKKSIPIPNKYTKRRYFSFIDSKDIIFDGVEMDVPVETESSLSLIYLSSTTRDVRMRDNIISNYANIYSEVEIGSTEAQNTFQESGTIFNHWAGGGRVVISAE